VNAPSWVRALLDALRFDAPDARALCALDDRSRHEALAWCDREHITLRLGPLDLPRVWRAEVDARRAANRERNRRLEAVTGEIAGALEGAGVPFLVLKGRTHVPDFAPAVDERVQYDLDLYSPREEAPRARDALAAMGYEPVRGFERFPTDHLPVMVRKTGWQWRGDYFDVEIPYAVEVHYRLWDERTEGFAAPGVEDFWARREGRALCTADRLGYAALHILRHLLRGSLVIGHVYELAWFLQHRQAAFWDEWRALHPEGLRALEAIAFRLAAAWFGCPSPAAPPPEAERWIERYATAPIESRFHPNKHELWLHLPLIESTAGKLRVLRRRVIPATLPGMVDTTYVRDEDLTLSARLRARARYAAFLAGRATHHARAIPALAVHGAAFWLDAAPGFGRYLGAAFLFHLGSFIFVLLYNLHLLDRGLREDAIGLVGGAMTAGSIAGTVLAWRLSAARGIRATLLTCFATGAVVSALRVWVEGLAPLAAGAVLGGAVFGLWAVSISPAVAALSSEARRPRAFGLFFSSGIATGVLGGWLGGRLPDWMGSRPAALAAGCALMGLALIPAWGLRFPARHEAERRRFRGGAFLRRFLPPLALWSLAIGVFNPFFNVYFATERQAGAATIGDIFSVSQMVQAAAVMAAPALLRWLGLVSGVMCVQILAGVAVAALPWAPGVAAASACYIGYMAGQTMSEPGAYSLLMSRVAPSDRGGASALNFLVMFSVQALTAVAAGWAFRRFGYALVLPVAGAAAVGAGLLFRLLLKPFENPDDLAPPSR
jgi:hypothetical protein